MKDGRGSDRSVNELVVRVGVAPSFHCVDDVLAGSYETIGHPSGRLVRCREDPGTAHVSTEESFGLGKGWRLGRGSRNDPLKEVALEVAACPGAMGTVKISESSCLIAEERFDHLR